MFNTFFIPKKRIHTWHFVCIALILCFYIFMQCKYDKDVSDVSVALLGLVGVFAGLQQWRHHLKIKALDKVESHLAFLHRFLDMIKILGSATPDKAEEESLTDYRDRIYNEYKSMFEEANRMIYELEMYIPDIVLEETKKLKEKYDSMNSGFAGFIFKRKFKESFTISQIQEEWSKAFISGENAEAEIKKMEDSIINLKKGIRNKWYDLGL